MEFGEQLAAAKFDGLDPNSIVPIDAACRANRTYLLERKKKKAAADKSAPTITTSNSKGARLDVKVSVTDSVLGAL